MSVAVKKSRAFRAIKGVLMRILTDGYSANLTQMTVSESDRQRLRDFCESKNISMVEGFHQLLDLAGCPDIPQSAATGKISHLVDVIIQKTNEYDTKLLAQRAKEGQFDDLIEAYLKRK